MMRHPDHGCIERRLFEVVSSGISAIMAIRGWFRMSSRSTPASDTPGRTASMRKNGNGSQAQAGHQQSGQQGRQRGPAGAAVFTTAMSRRARRRRVLMAAAGLLVLVGGGGLAFWQLDGRTDTNVGGVLGEGVVVPPASVGPSGTLAGPVPPSVGPQGATPGRATASATVGAATPAPGGTTGRTAAPVPQVTAAGVPTVEADGVTVTTTGGGPGDSRTFKIVSARKDLTGQREMVWAADAGTPVGKARCTQNFKFGPNSRKGIRKTLLLCWRTSAQRSVYTIAVDMRGVPSRKLSVDELNRVWDSLA
jgi:hypothetical protein